MKNTSIIKDVFIKFKSELIVLFYTIITFLTPILGLISLVFFAVVLDTCAGIYIARKKNDYQSDKLFNIVVKTFFYTSTILLTYLIDIHIFEGTLFQINFLMSKITTAFWIYIEGKSIDEKSQKLGNKPFLDIVTNIIKKVKSLKKDINEIKE